MAKSFSQNIVFLKTAYDQFQEAIVVIDSDCLITYINPVAEKIINKSAKSVIGSNVFSEIRITDHLGKKKTISWLSSFYKQSESFEEEVFLKTFSGIKKNKIVVTAILKPSEKPTGYILRFFEVLSEIKLLEDIREGERKYKALFESAQEGIFIMDDNGIILDANPSASKIYGRVSFLGLSIFELFPHNSKQENEKFWKVFMTKGEINGFYKFNLPNGEIKYIDFKARKNYSPGFHLAVLSDETKKRFTEKALRNSEANMKAIFDSSDQSIILLGLEMSIIAFNLRSNQMTASILGKKMIIGEHILNYIVNKDLFISEFNKAKKGTKVVVERNIIGVDGLDNWIEFSYIPIKNNKGSVVSICFTSTRINKRKLEALVLKESEQKFRSLSESSPDIIYIIDLVTRKITYFNRDNILGYSSSLLITSEAWIEIVSPEDYKKVVDHWNKFLKSKSKKSHSIDYRIRRLGGDYEWVSNRHIIVEWDSKGIPTKVLLNITVITDQIKAQEALRRSEAKLKALIENTNDLVWSVDNEISLTAANAAFNELIKNNYKRKVNLGDNLYSALPNLSKDGWLALHVTALKGKRVTAEFSWVSKKKEAIFYEISYNPIYDSENNVSGVSVFARDITQRKNNEATIVQTNFELDSFVYRASHDLRAPLKSILGLVNIINNQANETDKVNYLRLIEKSAIKLDNFISDLINFSRNSRASVDIEEVDFNVIIAECKETLRFMEGAEKVEFISKVKGNTDFYSDTKRISIFLQNFLSNAIKYYNPSLKIKSYVDIQVLISKVNAVITIEDNGVGIKKEYLPKIFNMFYRASENSFGSGLGLYIARQAVERLGGEIKVDSKLGIGTTFTITLPNLESKMFEFTSM